MRANHTKPYAVQIVAIAAVLFAPFVVSAVSSQLNINQTVNTSTSTPEETPEEVSEITPDSGGVIITAAGAVASLKISDIAIAPTPDSVNVAWSTDKPLISRVRWGTTKEYESGEFIKSDEGTYHSVSIENLSPDTLYYLLIESEEDGNVTSWFTQTFITLPISIPPPFEEVKLPARPAPPVLEEKEEVIGEAVPLLEPEKRVREPFGGAIRRFFLRVAAGIEAAVIFAVDRFKGLFFKN